MGVYCAQLPHVQPWLILDLPPEGPFIPRPFSMSSPTKPSVCFISAAQKTPTQSLAEKKSSCHFTMEVADPEKPKVGSPNISLARQQPDIEIPPAKSLRQ